MPYQVEIKPKALKVLKSIPRDDNERIIDRIKELSVNPRNDHVIKLSGFQVDTYRARQGDYRIFFTICDDKLIVEVIEIKHRKDAYK